MTNRDWTHDDARELAEFAGLELTDTHNDDLEKCIGWRDGNFFIWKPWSLEAPAWQIQSLLDAVREKGLEVKFCKELRSVRRKRFSMGRVR